MSNCQQVIQNPPRRRPNFWAAAVRGVIVAVLAVSAILKAQQAASEPVPAPAFVALQAGCEWCLAVWLISRIWPRLAHRAVVGLMAVFCGVSLWSFWQGAGSCGCFGRVPVPPLLTAGFDIAAAVLLFLAGPCPTLDHLSRKRMLVAGVVALAGSSAMLLAVLSYEPGRLTAGNSIAGDARHVVLDVESWVGKPFPLTHHLVNSPGLDTGKWRLLFVHHDCPGCQDLLRSESLAALKLQLQQSGYWLLLVQVPPVSRDLKLPAGIDMTELDGSRNWLIQTPAWVELENGLVRRAETVSASLAAMPRPLTKRVAAPSGEETCNLGYVPPKTLSRVSLRLRNASSQPWRFRRVISECSCAMVVSYPTNVPPGQEGEVVLLFAAPEQPLLYRKPIAFIPEGTRQPVIRYLTARIGIPLAIEPDTVDAGRITPGRPVTKKVRVFNDADAAVTLVNATSEDPACVLELSQKPVEAHAAQTLTVTIDPADKAAGKYSANLSIQTSSSVVPSLSLAITYEVVAGPAN